MSATLRTGVSIIIGIAGAAIMFIYGLRGIIDYIIGAEAHKEIIRYSMGPKYWLFLTWLPLSIYFGYKSGEAFQKKSLQYLKFPSLRPETKIILAILMICLFANIIISKYYAKVTIGTPTDLATLLADLLCMTVYLRHQKSGK